MILPDLLPVLSATLAAGAAALAVRGPRHKLTRASTTHDLDHPLRTPSGMRALFLGRPDAVPMRHRVLVAAAGAAAIIVAFRAEMPGSAGWLGVGLAPIVAVIVVAVLGQLEPGGVRHRRRQLIMDLPQALELMSACLAAGLPLRSATAAVAAAVDGPVAEELGGVTALVDLGVSDAEAWLVLKGHPQLGAAAVDLARSVESGTMMVDTLAHHARDARAMRRGAMEVAAKAVGVQSVLPLMTCFIPAFMLIGIVPTVASAMLNTLF